MQWRFARVIIAFFTFTDICIYYWQFFWYTFIRTANNLVKFLGRKIKTFISLRALCHANTQMLHNRLIVKKFLIKKYSFKFFYCIRIDNLLFFSRTLIRLWRIFISYTVVHFTAWSDETIKGRSCVYEA